VKKKMIFVLIPVGTIILTMVIMMLLNPLFLRSERQIRSNILKLTPIGMSIDEVVETVRNETKWETLTQTGWIPLASFTEDIIQSYMYERAEAGLIWLFLGRSFGYYSVTADWKFDENGKLVDVTVRKELAI
jgi:hypothetical protein